MSHPDKEIPAVQKPIIETYYRNMKPLALTVVQVLPVFCDSNPTTVLGKSILISWTIS